MCIACRALRLAKMVATHQVLEDIGMMKMLPGMT